MVSCGMLRGVAFVRTEISEELSASIIRVTRIGELGMTLAVTANVILNAYSISCISLITFVAFIRRESHTFCADEVEC
jgi:hypothetical protein